MSLLPARRRTNRSTGRTQAGTIEEAVKAAEVAITSFANDDAVRQTALSDRRLPAPLDDAPRRRPRKWLR